MKVVKIKKMQKIQCNRKQEPNICEGNKRYSFPIVAKLRRVFNIYRMSVTRCDTESDENNYIMKKRRASRAVNLGEMVIILLCGQLTTSNIWLDFFFGTNKRFCIRKSC